jgi:cGMP-dependent protein kinase
MANSYYIIKSGIISILKGGKEIRKMEAGDSFGEQALY